LLVSLYFGKFKAKAVSSKYPSLFEFVGRTALKTVQTAVAAHHIFEASPAWSSDYSDIVDPLSPASRGIASERRLLDSDRAVKDRGMAFTDAMLMPEAVEGRPGCRVLWEGALGGPALGGCFRRCFGRTCFGRTPVLLVASFAMLSGVRRRLVSSFMAKVLLSLSMASLTLRWLYRWEQSTNNPSFIPKCSVIIY
jgi:hypothetical protein